MVSIQEDFTTHFEDILPKPLDNCLQNFQKTRRQFLQQKVVYRNSVIKNIQKKL